MISIADSDMYIGLHSLDFSTGGQYRRYSLVNQERADQVQTEAHYNRQRWVELAVEQHEQLFVVLAPEFDYRLCAGPDLFSNGHQKAWMRVIVESPPFLTQGYDLIFFKLRKRALSDILHAAVKFLGYKYKMSCKAGDPCDKSPSACKDGWHSEGSIKCSGDPPDTERPNLLMQAYAPRSNRRNKNRSTRNRRNKNRSSRNRR